LDFRAGLGFEGRSAQADDVDSREQIKKLGHREWWDVFVELRPSGDHGALSDANELMEHRTSPQNGPVAHLRIAAEKAVVHDNDFVANLHIVPEMASHHEETLIADTRHSAFLRAAMDRHIFTDAVVIADHHRAFDLRRVGVILRRGTDNSAVANGVAFSEGGVALDDRMGLDHATRADLNAGTNYRAGTDFDIFAQTGFG
jgi:hypothetical protein